MNSGKGARSFYETIIGYLQNGWKVTLIVPYNTDVDIEGVTVISEGLTREKVSRYRYIQSTYNYLNSKKDEKYYKHKGIELIEAEDASLRNNTILYAYEVHAVKACKWLADRYSLPLVTRFQGTIMSNKKYGVINRLGYYPHFQALRTAADLIIMADDGTQGDKCLMRIGNSSEVLFLRNGVNLDTNFSSEELVDLREKYDLEGQENIRQLEICTHFILFYSSCKNNIICYS